MVYQVSTNGIPNVNQNLTNGRHSIVESSIDKNSIDKSSSSNINININNNSGLNENDSCVDDFYLDDGSDSCVDGFQKVIDFYNNNIGLLTPYGLELLQDYAKEIEPDAIVFALKKATEANQRHLSYIKAILNTWSNKGIKTLVEAQEETTSFINNKNKATETTTETEEEKLARKKKAIEEAMKRNEAR